MTLSLEFQQWLNKTGIVPGGDPSGLPPEQQAPIFYMSYAFDQGDILTDQKLSLVNTSKQIDLTSKYLHNEQLRQEISQSVWPQGDPTMDAQLAKLLNDDSALSLPAYVPGGPAPPGGVSADQVATGDQLDASIASAQKILDFLQNAQKAATSGTDSFPLQLIQWPWAGSATTAVSNWFQHEGLSPTTLPQPPFGSLTKPPDGAPQADVDAFNKQESLSTDWSNQITAARTAWTAHYNALTTQITTDNNAWQSQAQSLNLPIQMYLTNFSTAVTNVGELIAKRKDAVTTPVNNMASG